MDPYDQEFPEHTCIDSEQLQCVIAAGDLGDLPGMRAWLAALPEHTYGQVFIEVFAPHQVQQLSTPAHVGVTWICREELRPSTRPGIGIPRGQALAHAVDAWLDEWVRADAGAWHYSLWMGARSSSIMRSYWQQIEAELSESWLRQVRP